MSASSDGAKIFAVLGTEGGEAEHVLFDVRNGKARRITTHRTRFGPVAISDDGSILASVAGGAIEVGGANGGRPHLLVYDSGKGAVTISPDRKWVASSTVRELRLWPMPDLSKPPLHTLPLPLLIEKLHELTNLRVVADSTSPDGYKLTEDRFSGWIHVPNWR